MNTELKNSISAAADKAQYDDCAKRLLAQKRILAHILVKTVDEFKGIAPKDAETFIEGEPYISVVPTEPGLTNTDGSDTERKKIVGLNTENSEINEGLVRFDIIFYVRLKNGLTQIIVNLEIQKSEPTKYHILNRAIFYVSRMVSSQKERDFAGMRYDDIKSVVSIWICMDTEANSMSHFHFVKDEMLEPYDWGGNIDMINIVLLGIKNELPAHDDKYELHRLLGALLSEKLGVSEKMNIIEREYDIPLADNLKEGVDSMCNLGQGIEDKAVEKLILKMYESHLPIEQIATISEKTVEEVKAIIKKYEPALV